MRVPLELFAHLHGHIERKRQMRRVRAYSRDERKRLIINVLATAMKVGEPFKLTCAEIAKSMDIVPSTKLRQILAEMVAAGTLRVERQQDAGIAGFRLLYELNPETEAYAWRRVDKKAEEFHRAIRLNTAHGAEMLVLS
jgi:hypothetical protein